MRPRRGLVKGRAASESVQPPRGWRPPTREGGESRESEVAGEGRGPRRAWDAPLPEPGMLHPGFGT